MDSIRSFSRFKPSFKRVYEATDAHLLAIEGIAPEQLDTSLTAQRYFKERTIDFSIDDNANNMRDGICFGNYFTEVGKSQLKLIGYHDLYTVLEKNHGSEHAGNLMHNLWHGDLYFHDSTAMQIPYCWAASLDFLLHRGNCWGALRSFPAKRTYSFIDQVKTIIIELSQEVAGAIALGDLFVCYSYFVKKNNLNVACTDVRADIQNDFQSLVHMLNREFRSHQPPFTNLSIFDRPNLELLFADTVFPDSSRPDFDLILEIQKIFCTWFIKGDPNTGMPYRFPVVTLNLRTDDQKRILDHDALDYFSEINRARGCFNIYISSGNKIASCCRLTNDLDLAGADSFGNGGLSLGSHRVVSINVARLGHRATSHKHLKKLLLEQLDNARDIVMAHRRLLEQRNQEGFLRFFRYGLMSMERFFSTFGICGIYECLEEQGISILSDQGKERAIDLLQLIKDYATKQSKKLGVPFNVEQVPAESLAIKFAKKDAYLYAMDYALYANQFVPLWVDCDITQRIAIDGCFSKILTGGGISHINIAEQLTHKNQMKQLIEHATQSGCEHFAVNYNYCLCKNNHITIAGPSALCPLCAAPVIEQYTRIVGYHVPVSAWSTARQHEHKKRAFGSAPEIQDYAKRITNTKQSRAS